MKIYFSFQAGLIRHAVNKISFSEQCYYVFGDLSNRMQNLNLQDIEGSEEDTLAPLASASAPTQMGMFLVVSLLYVAHIFFLQTVFTDKK